MKKMSKMLSSKTNKKSVLNVYVSCFKNFAMPNNPRKVNLLTWLMSDKYKSKVQVIRNEHNKLKRDRLKAKLPAITPSGTFRKRQESELINHSGLIQFDIDFKDNLDIKNYEDLKSQICNVVNVAYLGLSVSGKGYWGLVPIKHIDKHKQHFKALDKAFTKLGVVIDTAPANVASLRGYSFDDEAYFNHNALVFDDIVNPVKFSKLQLKTNIKEFDLVQRYIYKIIQRNIDITENYKQWFEIGCSFANEFDEQGREYFHCLSQFHSDYSRNKTDRQFDNCLKHKYGFSIRTFFYYCSIYGVNL
jgi:hypothetical protein